MGLVHIRRWEASARYEIQQLKRRRVNISRRIWVQQARLGQLTGPRRVRRRADEMALDLTDRDPLRVVAAEGYTANDR